MQVESNENGKILPLKHLSLLSFANIKDSSLTRFGFENIMSLRLVKFFNTALSVIGSCAKYSLGCFSIPLSCN